jgi:ESS family glutamate:Na+ symporter
MNIKISTVATLLVALLILFAGYYLNSKIAFLKITTSPSRRLAG